MHKTTIARALGYLARYKVEFVLSLAMALVYVVASLYIPLVAGEAIDSLVTGGVDFDMLLSCLMRIFVTALVCFISQYALSRLNNRMAYRISHDMRNDAFDKISRSAIWTATGRAMSWHVSSRMWTRCRMVCCWASASSSAPS